MASLRIHGRVRVWEYDLKGNERRHWVLHNTVTSGGLTLLRDYLIARQAQLAPTPPMYLALGSGLTSQVGRFSTRLPGETFRTEIVAADPNGLSAVYHFFLGTSDNSQQTVAHYGLFAGPATNAANTGILFAVVAEALPFSKDPTSTYAGDWTITLSGSLEA